jgi:hypothetical protein
MHRFRATFVHFGQGGDRGQRKLGAVPRAIYA